MKFGYYGSEDIKALLRPLIAVLDCRHDKPFPPESDKGILSHLSADNSHVTAVLLIHKSLVHQYWLLVERVD